MRDKSRVPLSAFLCVQGKRQREMARKGGRKQSTETSKIERKRMHRGEEIIDNGN
jgi:hypothetical protein